ncbi:NB-ARC domain-containing protein [Pannus brasiliensis CCIBt3594]|uniref:NB-ARC domain-containing protein n=1 Tax=Pannus brasiliensis CCIBt3594 TaxID=1427578 RepID=A0AAW9QLQ3_9CHRO
MVVSSQLPMTSEDALELIEGLIAPRPLNKIQRSIARYTWEGLSYSEIARREDYDLGYVRDTGSKLWKLLSEATGRKITKNNLKAVLKHYSCQNAPVSPTLNPRLDRGEAIDLQVFYGRERELDTLHRWLADDRCRLVTLLGLGGVGKTTIAVKLVKDLEATGNFEFIIWKSLQSAPRLDELLTALLQFLDKENTPAKETETAKLARLQQFLQTRRCLLVLDNFDALFSPGQNAGTYREGYENYRQFTRSIAWITHRSRAIVTSRESIAEIREFQGPESVAREWRLTGLERNAARQLLSVKGIEGTDKEIARLIDAYQGHPLALKIAASSIQNLFAGKLENFLEPGVTAWGGIRQLLETQIARLSPAEQSVMYWLAIERESVTVKELQGDIFPPLSLTVILETLESLKARSLIEVTTEGFALQPVVMEHLTEQFIVRLTAEISRLVEPSFFYRYALQKATAKDYIRDSQIRSIVEPIVHEAIARFGGRPALLDRLQEWLKALKTGDASAQGYAASNLITLFIYLEVDLTGFDFAGLLIRQADLARVQLTRVNFSGAELRDCVFARTFGGITDVTFSPDGQFLAAGDTAGEVHLWRIDNGEQLLAVSADLSWNWAVAIGPDGRFLATGGDDRVVKLWDIRSATCWRELRGHAGTINDLAFHPEGKLLASGALDGTIRLWPIESLDGEPMILTGHQGRVWSLAFSPDGNRLVSASEDKTLKLWDVRAGKLCREWNGYGAWLKTVAFSPDGETIACGSFDGSIEILRGEKRHRWKAHANAVTSIAFSPDGSCLVSSSYDQSVKLWDVASRECLRAFTEHSNRVWSVAFSPDGKSIASGGDDNTTRLWQIRTGRCAKAWKGYSNAILAIAVDENAGLLATAQEDRTVRLWSAETGKMGAVFYGHSDRVLAVARSPDRPLLASGSADRTIKLWEMDTGKCLRTFEGHQSWVWSVAFHPDGKQFASGSYDRSIKFWDLETGECKRTLTGHAESVRDLVFSPDGDRLYSASFDRTIGIWDTESGERLQTLTGHENTVWAIALSPDGRSLASTGYDRTVKLWDTRSGECLRVFPGHAAPGFSIAFSPDGKMIFSGSLDRTIKIWDIESDRCRETLTGHTGSVSTLALYKGNLVSGSFDRSFCFWDYRDGRCLYSARAPRPYEDMDITRIKGLSEFQIARMKALGAIGG